MAAEEAPKLAESGSEEPARHIGYYLLGAGRAALLRRLGCNRPEERGKVALFLQHMDTVAACRRIGRSAFAARRCRRGDFLGVLFFLLATQPAAELVNSIAGKACRTKASSEACTS